MYDSIIKLVAQTTSVNEYGDSVVTETARSIFAEVKSIGQSEFYQAQAVGMKPEIKFVIADFADYEGEEILRYAPFGGTEETYKIIRTYRTKMALEIVCKRGID
jgi:SPP1 family predicted phage head-tail adaptor